MDDFLNFRTAKAQLKTLYGLSISDDEFDELALYAWDQIGNKRYKTYIYKESVPDDGIVMLPCNIDGKESIEGIFSNQEDALISDGRPGINLSSLIVENYIESYKDWSQKGFHQLYHPGSLINYEFLGDSIKVNSGISEISILYKGIIFDEDGLPFINKKERDAISTFCAYVIADREAFGSKDKNQEYFSQKYEARWKIQKGKARSPISVSQNEFDKILDVTHRWDRKRYNLGYKPISR